MKLAHLLSLVGILLLGAFLRLYQLDLMKFGDEEATQLRLALGWVEQGRLPLVGLLTSTDLYRPAGFPYLLIPVVLVTRHPLLATAFVSLANVASIALAYRIVRAYFGRREALLASLVYASSFWATYAGRHLWDQGLMAPVALLFLDRILAATVHRRAAALGWAVFWAAAGTLVHPSAAVLLGVALVTTVALRLPVRPTALAAPLLLAGAMWTPFLSHVALTRGRDVEVAGLLLARQPTADLEGMRLALWQLFPNPAEPLFQVRQGSIFPANLGLEWLQPMAALLFLVTLAWCTGLGLPACWRTSHPGRSYLVVVLAYVVPLAVMVRHAIPIYNHYVYVLLPFSAIILALGLARFRVPSSWFRVVGSWFAVPGSRLGTRGPRNSERETRKWGWRWALGAAVAMAAGQAWFFLTYVQWLATEGTTFGSGVPFRTSQEALTAATSLRASSSDPVHIASRPESALLYGYLVSPAVVVDHERTLVFSAADGPLVYVTVADGSRAAGLLRQQFPGTERFHRFRTYAAMMGMGGMAIATSFPDPQQLDTLRASPPDFYRVYLLPPDAGRLAQEGVVRTRGPWWLDSGIRLEGYDVASEVVPGHDLLLTLAWTVDTNQGGAAGDRRFFAHLLDRLGRKWAEASELDYDPSRWRQGDRVISWLRIPAPPEAPPGLYTLSLGMFDAESMEPVPIATSAGTVDSLTAGPLRAVPAEPPQAPQHVVNPAARFGEAIELVGYDLLTATTGGDATLRLRLLWRATQRPAADYTVFAHLLDQQGQILSQEDGFPAGGLYPTSAWRPGELVEDQRSLSLPAEAAGRRLSVALGWYRVDTGDRLPLDSGSGSESALLLGPFASGL